MSNYVQLGDVHTYYEEDGKGDALVLLHPGLADSRAFEEYVPELAQHFHLFRPDRRGHGRTPDVEGPEQFPVVTAKLDRMHRGEPALTVADLAGYTRPALVVVGHSDEEIAISTRSPFGKGSPTRSSPSCPAPRTDASTPGSSSSS